MANPFKDPSLGSGALSIAGVHGGIESVGTGGTYSDISAAIAAGKHNLILLSAVTEDSHITLTADLRIDCNGFTLTMAAFQFVYTTYNSYVEMNGGGITWAQTIAGEDLWDSGSGDITLKNGILTNNSTQANCQPWYQQTSKLTVENVKYFLPNLDGCWMYTFNGESFFKNIWCVGGGAACGNAIGILGGSAYDIRVSGAFDPLEDTVTVSGYDSSIHGLQVDNCYAIVTVSGGAQLSHINVEGAFDVDVDISGRSQIYGGDSSNSKIQLTVSGSYSVVQDLYGIEVLTTSSAKGARLVRCTIKNAATISQDFYTFESCYFTGGASVSSGADDNTFQTCIFGTIFGSGSLTLTVDSGSNRTRINGVSSDAALVDNGTGTIVSGNAVH